MYLGDIICVCTYIGAQGMRKMTLRGITRVMALHASKDVLRVVGHAQVHYRMCSAIKVHKSREIT